MHSKKKIIFISLVYFVVIITVRGFEYENLLKLATFPPKLDDEKPAGHNKPLGSQRPPEGPIIEYTQALNANEYWEKHVKDHIPLVYRGYIKDSPAIKLWDDQYLAEKYGDLDVLVEHKTEDRTSTSGRMRLKDFVKNYKDQDMYVVSMFPSEMMGEVKAIPSVLCGTFKNYTHESNLWISNGGTRSVIHYDADHNLHCLLAGRKDFIMINNNLTTQTNLYFKRKDPGVGSGFSFLDPDTIDMNKFPKISKVPWTYATLYPGDCIYIPSVYIHQVRGYGRTIAITTLFTADVGDNFNGDDCTDELMNNYHSMADIKFQWTYKRGDKTIDMGYMNVELVRARLLEGLKDDDFSKNGVYTKKQFISFAGVFSPYGRNKTKIGEVWNNVFGFSDDHNLDKKSILKIPMEQLKIFCRTIEAPHGVVTNGTESVFVRPGERHQWEIDHPDDDDDAYMTEFERKVKEEASRDPMFDFLSDEEKEEYIAKKKAEKAKYGIDYDLDEHFGKNNFDYYIPWRINDIPKKYQNIIANGKLPDDYKEEFISNLPENVKEKFAQYFEKGRVPKSLVRYLTDTGQESYKKVEKKNLDEGDEEEEENESDEDREGEARNENEFPFSFDDLDRKRRKQFLHGKIARSDIKEFLKFLPESLSQYEGAIKQGVVPDEVLMVLMKANEGNFEEKVHKYKESFKGKQKVEL